MGGWLSRLFREPVGLAPPPMRDCSFSGHHFEGRYDEEPTMVVTAADIIAFQGASTSKTSKYHKNSNSWEADHYYVPEVSVEAQIQLVNAHKKRTYVCDVCRFCGKTLRLQREG